MARDMRRRLNVYENADPTAGAAQAFRLYFYAK
jgi:hypothetical protein